MKTSHCINFCTQLHRQNTLLHFCGHVFYFGANEVYITTCINSRKKAPPRARNFFSYCIFFQTDLLQKAVNKCNKFLKSVPMVLRCTFLKMQFSVLSMKVVHFKNASKNKG